MNKESKNTAMKFALYLNSKDIVDILFDEKFYKDDFKYLHDNIEENGHPYNTRNEAGVYFIQKYKIQKDKKIIKNNISTKQKSKARKLI